MGEAFEGEAQRRWSQMIDPDVTFVPCKSTVTTDCPIYTPCTNARIQPGLRGPSAAWEPHVGGNQNLHGRTSTNSLVRNLAVTTGWKEFPLQLDRRGLPMRSNIMCHGFRSAGERCGEKMGTTGMLVMKREAGGRVDRNASHRRHRRGGPSEHSSVLTLFLFALKKY